MLQHERKTTGLSSEQTSVEITNQLLHIFVRKKLNLKKKRRNSQVLKF